MTKASDPDQPRPVVTQAQCDSDYWPGPSGPRPRPAQLVVVVDDPMTRRRTQWTDDNDDWPVIDSEVEPRRARPGNPDPVGGPRLLDEPRPGPAQPASPVDPASPVTVVTQTVNWPSEPNWQLTDSDWTNDPVIDYCVWTWRCEGPRHYWPRPAQRPRPSGPRPSDLIDGPIDYYYCVTQLLVLVDRPSGPSYWWHWPIYFTQLTIDQLMWTARPVSPVTQTQTQLLLLYYCGPRPNPDSPMTVTGNWTDDS